MDFGTRLFGSGNPGPMQWAAKMSHGDQADPHPSRLSLPGATADLTFAGMSIVTLPAGDVDVDFVPQGHIIGIEPAPATPKHLVMDGRDLTNRAFRADGVCWMPASMTVRVLCRHDESALVIELEPGRTHALAQEALGEGRLKEHFLPWQYDPATLPVMRLLRDHLQSGAVDRLFAQGLSLAIVSRGLQRAAYGFRQVPSAGTDRRIARAVDFIEAHLGDALCVESLSAVALMSPSYFARCFKSATGEPVWRYVMRRRLEWSKERLVTTDEPISSLALTCGFAHQGHFTAAFRRAFGATPGAYRRSEGRRQMATRSASEY